MEFWAFDFTNEECQQSISRCEILSMTEPLVIVGMHCSVTTSQPLQPDHIPPKLWSWLSPFWDEKMSRCVVWECVAALDLGDMAAPAPAREKEKLHPHVKAPTSLPVPQLSPPLSLCYQHSVTLFNQVEFTNCMHVVQCSTSSLSRGYPIWSSV